MVGNSWVGTCLTLPNLGFLWVFFKYPKISKNGDSLFFPVMPDTGNVKDCFELPPTFSIFTLKNVTWPTYFISFTVRYCFLFCFVCIELVSLIWFLQIWVEIYVYGTMINWITLIKKLMQTYIVIVYGSIVDVSTVHLNGIWHLIWRYLSKTVLGGHPVLSGHYEGVRLIQVSLYNKHDLTLQTIHTRKSGWKGSWIRWTVNNIIY